MVGWARTTLLLQARRGGGSGAGEQLTTVSHPCRLHRLAIWRAQAGGWPFAPASFDVPPAASTCLALSTLQDTETPIQTISYYSHRLYYSQVDTACKSLSLSPPAPSIPHPRRCCHRHCHCRGRSCHHIRVGSRAIWNVAACPLSPTTHRLSYPSPSSRLPVTEAPPKLIQPTPTLPAHHGPALQSAPPATSRWTGPPAAIPPS